MLEGNRPSVSELFVERIKTGSQPHNRRDPYTLAFIPEGGAQRTVYSAGGTTALQALNALPAFDTIHAVSGGAPVGAYFETDQTPEGASILYNYLASKRYVDPTRLSRGGPVLDLSYARSTMQDLVPLNWQKLIESEVPLHVYLTSVRDGSVIDRHKFIDQADILDTLTATMRIPLISGWPFDKANRGDAIDGGIGTGGLPVKEAIFDGATHILAWHTQPEGAVIRQSNILDMLGASLFKTKYPGLAKAMLYSSRKYQKALAFLAAGHNQSKTVLADTIRPPKSVYKIKQLERRRQVMLWGTQQGYLATVKKYQTFNLPINPAIRVLT